MRVALFRSLSLPRFSVLRHGTLAAFALGLLAFPREARAEGANDSPSTGAVPGGSSGAAIVPGQRQPQPPAAKPSVKPPQLKQFVSAPYPQEAKDKGIEGNVVLQLDIDADGKVANVVVVNPAGNGMDEAATTAARQFVFEPALRDGKPVPARILYRYNFTLQAKAPEPNAPAGGQPAAAGPIKNLSGAVKTTVGEAPIANATITVRDAAGVERVATATEEGAWAFVDLPSGKYTVRIQAPGYMPLEVEESITKTDIFEAVYRLSAEGIVEVVVRGKRPPREVTKRTIEQREIDRIPGTGGDAIRSVENMPGVARPPGGFAGILIVRGSSPQDTAISIEGIEVPLVYHFGGLSSVVPTELLSKIDFYPGNFSTQYGRVMGGIVDVGLRAPKNDGKYHGMGQIDLIDMRVLAEGPLPFVKGWTFAIGGRRSWFDAWLKPVLTQAGASVTAAPVYYDWQMYAQTEPSARSMFRVGFFGADDRLSLLSKDASGQDAVLAGNLRFNTTFWRLFARYDNDFTDNLSLHSVTSYGENKIGFGVGQLHLDIAVHPIQNRTELSYRMGKGATAHAGIDMFYASTDISILAPPIPREGEPAPGPYATRPPLAFDSTTTAYRPAAYMEMELTPYRRVKLVPGVRADYAKDTKRWDVSPRFNARFVLSEGFPQTTLKGGIGVFTRPPEFQESYRPFGTPGLRSNRSIHYALGVEQEITKQIDLSVEGFYKALDMLVARSPDATGSYTYNNLGSGYVVGSEFLLRFKPSDRFFGWIAYTLSRSMLRQGPNEDLKLFNFDQTHILTALGSYRLGRGWEFGARFRVISGNPYTPVVGSIYDASAGTYGAIESRNTFSARFPLYTQLDLRVDKGWQFDGWRMSTYLDVQNVYYSQAVQGFEYNYNFTQSSPVSGLPIIPSIGVRGQF